MKSKIAVPVSEYLLEETEKVKPQPLEKTVYVGKELEFEDYVDR
jgi:hypothetical protein